MFFCTVLSVEPVELPVVVAQQRPRPLVLGASVLLRRDQLRPRLSVLRDLRPGPSPHPPALQEEVIIPPAPANRSQSRDRRPAAVPADCRHGGDETLNGAVRREDLARRSGSRAHSLCATTKSTACKGCYTCAGMDGPVHFYCCVIFRTLSLSPSSAAGENARNPTGESLL